MTTRGLFTDRTIASLQKGTLRDDHGKRKTWITEPAGASARGGGVFLVRRHRAGSVGFFYRYARADGTRKTVALGAYPATSLADARAKARQMSNDLATSADRTADDPRRRQDAERVADAGRETGTLRKLCEAYVTYLETRKRISTKEVRRLLNTHVIEAHPRLAAKPAATIDRTDVLTILRKLIDADKGRTAAKLRASLRAAFELALSVEDDATVPKSFESFGVKTNPVAATKSLSKFNKTGDRTLDADELGAYVRALRKLEHPAKRAALLVGLYLGGQRTDQLIRVTRADVDLNAKTIRLYDPKGKRQQPRVHMLPMTPTVLSIVRERITDDMEPKDRLFPVANNGKRALGSVVTVISDSTKSPRGSFQLRDIRRTCETMMAAIGISKDVRAQIQSHGLGGVQALHYDRHDYAAEKAEALAKWGRHLQKIAGKRGHPSKI